MKILFLLLSCLTLNAQVRFDGSSYLYTSAAEAFRSMNFTNDISVSFWIIKEAGLSTSGEFLGKGRLFAGTQLHWSIRNASGKFEWNFAAPHGTFHNFTTTSAFSQTNVPIHVVYTSSWYSSNTSTFYINGSRVAAAWTANPVNTVGLTNAEPFQIGRTYAGSGVISRIWDVAVWNGILTDHDVKNLYSSCVSPLAVQPTKLTYFNSLAPQTFKVSATMSGTNNVISSDIYKTYSTPISNPRQLQKYISIQNQ